MNDGERNPPLNMAEEKQVEKLERFQDSLDGIEQELDVARRDSAWGIGEAALVAVEEAELKCRRLILDLRAALKDQS